MVATWRILIDGPHVMLASNLKKEQEKIENGQNSSDPSGSSNSDLGHDINSVTFFRNFENETRLRIEWQILKIYDNLKKILLVIDNLLRTFGDFLKR